MVYRYFVIGMTNLQFGRNEIYQVTSVLSAILIVIVKASCGLIGDRSALLFIPQATSRSFAGLLIARWFVSWR